MQSMSSKRGRKRSRSAIPCRTLRKYVMERDYNQCRYCGDRYGPFHLDHVVPVSKGGPTTPENLVVACQQCNYLKSDNTWTPRPLKPESAPAPYVAPNCAPKPVPKPKGNITAAKIEAGKSASGGWTKATLESWGVPWPAPKGWKSQLIACDALAR